MNRNIIESLVNWKVSAHRKPLILKGARQVGKTYILGQFGKENFRKTHAFNFEKNKEINDFFRGNLNPKKIIKDLSIFAGGPIDTTQDLLVFDEIQECPEALTSLKYFNEDLSELAVCAAGSLLGVHLSTESAPVGKVDILNMYPMTFHEFLQAAGDAPLLQAYGEALSNHSFSKALHLRLLSLLYEYFVCGGLPEAVSRYLDLRKRPQDGLYECRQVQKNIVHMHMADFAKHSGKNNSMHIVAIFENLPSQLASCLDLSVNRYRFKDVIPGKGSFRDLQGPIDWLVQAGLILKVKICNRAEIPLESFSSPNIFKCYLFDVGILGAMLDLKPSDVIDQKYGITRGYFAENYVAQELTARTQAPLYSWRERNSEVEFLQRGTNRIIPVEVKAGTRVKVKSLQQFIKKYSPDRARIISAGELSSDPQRVVEKIPLYLAGEWHDNN